MPSVLGHAQDHQLTWKAYTGTDSYPVNLYTQLKGSSNVVRSDEILTDAADLAAVSMVWHDSPFDEHPVADVSLGQDKIRQAVSAVVAAGHWQDTVFMLTWDDWGGWDDHVSTPNTEHTPDGVQLAFGPRVPLIVFGGTVRGGIDSRWNSHVSIGKTVLDLLGLPALGVPRLDDAVSLIDLIDPGLSNPEPPAHGAPIQLPLPPPQPPTPKPLPPPPTPTSAPVGPVYLRDGSTLPPPNDQPVTP